MWRNNSFDNMMSCQPASQYFPGGPSSQSGQLAAQLTELTCSLAVLSMNITGGQYLHTAPLMVYKCNKVGIGHIQYGY